jgi:hypothetical protein
MALFWRATVVFVAACLLDVASSKHVKRDQVVMSSTPNPKLNKFKDATEGSVTVKLTVSDIMKNANSQSLEKDKLMVRNSSTALTYPKLRTAPWIQCHLSNLSDFK